MATAVEVFGPYTISASVYTKSTATSGSASVIGRGDNDDLFKLDITYMHTDIFTNESGAMPYDSVRTGAKVTCSFSLIVIDRAQIATFMQAVDGHSAATGGVNYYPQVGTLAQDNTLNIIVNYTVGAVAKTLTVPRCKIVDRKELDFGNKGTKIAFNCESFVNQAAFEGALYTMA